MNRRQLSVSRRVIIVVVVVTDLIGSGLGVQLTQKERPPKGESKTPPESTTKPPDVFLEGGNFRMGLNDRNLVKTGEFPVKHIRVKPFKIDRYLVTNEKFRAFKESKPRYETDAETAGYSWVFNRHKTDDALHDTKKKHKDGPFQHAVRNATWYQPLGPGSSVDDTPNHPVVHVSYHDAYSYCLWAGSRLPSEYEWEYAARGGLNDTLYPWGNQTDVSRSNLWQGRFPDFNLAKDGYEGLSPVDAFPEQNNFGLHDMIGNVWEWTSTVFTIPRVENDPDNPEYTAKGGSHLDLYTGLTGYEAGSASTLQRLQPGLSLRREGHDNDDCTTCRQASSGRHLGIQSQTGAQRSRGIIPSISSLG